MPSWGAILISVTLILAFGEVISCLFYLGIGLLEKSWALLVWFEMLVCCFFGIKIIPQAVCSRYGLSVGARLAGVVRVLLLVFFPIAYPISKVSSFFKSRLIVLNISIFATWIPHKMIVCFSFFLFFFLLMVTLDDCKDDWLIRNIEATIFSNKELIDDGQWDLGFQAETCYCWWIVSDIPVWYPPIRNVDL